MMYNLSDHLKKELIKYIHREMNRGYSLDSIKLVLIKAGHRQNIIDEAISALKKNDFNILKALSEPAQSKLQAEAYHTMLNAVIKYIEYHIERGHRIEEVKKILLDYGHSEDAINRAIKKMREKSSFSYTLKMFIAPFAVLSFVAIFFATAVNTLAPTQNIFFGFLPTIATLASAVILADKLKQKSFLFILPFVFGIAFSFLAKSGNMAVFRDLDVRALTVVNLAISLVYVFIIVTATPPEYASRKEPKSK